MTGGSITCRRSRARTMVLLGLVVLTVLDTVSGIPYRRSLFRICSKGLSDALKLACKDRGYNEPFSYSDEDDPQDTLGRGLAEECCYHQCSYSQLEQYCKPNKQQDSFADAVDKSAWIVRSPSYYSGRPGTSSEERSKSDIDYVSGSIRCRIHGSKGARKKGCNTEREDYGGCDGKAAAGSMKRQRGGHCGCRHRRLKRRRHGKVLVDRPSKNEALSTELVSSNSKVSPFS